MSERIAKTSSARYRLVQGALRVCLALSGRSLRVLGATRAPASATVLYLCRPGRFLDALLMVAAWDRPLAVVTAREPRRRWQLLLASALNTITCGPEPQAWHSALRACTEILISGGAVLVLETPQPAEPSGDGTKTALALACEAWASAFPEQPPVVLPVQRFYPFKRGQDILIHIGGRLTGDDQVGARLGDAGSHGHPSLYEARGSSVFALDDSILEELLGDVKHALRDRLREEWKARPAWNQNVDGFRLSSCAAECLRTINQNEPGSLVALRHLSEANRETRRQWSLARLRAELGLKQLSLLKRWLGWGESVFGLPVACYGLLNHFIPALLLYTCGLSKRHQPLKAEPWLARTLVVIGCYGGQIALVNSVGGRAAAGYYALTLPVSGVYLLRYWRLLRRRTGLLLQGVWAASLSSQGEVTGKTFFEKLDQIFMMSITTSRLESP